MDSERNWEAEEAKELEDFCFRAGERSSEET